MAKVPDFDDMMKVVNEIKRLATQKMELETNIKFQESEVFKKAFTDQKYFQNGKAPSAEFVKNSYQYTGFNNELLPLRLEYADVTASLEQSRLVFDIMKMEVDIYRTESANQRYTSL
jgi:hypothetical protein